MTYYQALQMPPASTTEDLHEAYKMLALALHPDRCPGREEEFKALAEAWSVLKDAALREKYDKRLAFEGVLNCSTCLGRGLVFRWKAKGEVLCAHCGGTGREADNKL